MRVLFLASYFPRPAKPLVGTWALEQAKGLAAASDLLVACSTFYLPGFMKILKRARPWVDVPSTYKWGNVEVRYLKTKYYPVEPLKTWAYKKPQRQMNWAWRSAKKKLLRIVDEFKPDILFCHHTAVNGFFGWKLHQLTAIPYVITDHDYDEILVCEKYPQRKKFFEEILRHSGRQIAVSKRMQRDMQRIFPFAHTLTLHNGINFPPMEKIRETPRPPELEGKTIFLSVGMFASRKGFPLLVEAFAKIAQQYPNAVLRIGGDGQQRPEIEQAIAKHNLQNRVTLLGLVPHQQIFQEMWWSDAFALISWDEPFATVFLEAMAMGRPVITASDGGMTDVVEDGVHGLIVPPKDVDAAAAALERMIHDADLRKRMGQNAERLVHEKLTWTANTRQLLAIFEQVLAESKKV